MGGSLPFLSFPSPSLYSDAAFFHSRQLSCVVQAVSRLALNEEGRKGERRGSKQRRDRLYSAPPSPGSSLPFPRPVVYTATGSSHLLLLVLS